MSLVARLACKIAGVFMMIAAFVTWLMYDYSSWNPMAFGLEHVVHWAAVATLAGTGLFLLTVPKSS